MLKLKLILKFSNILLFLPQSFERMQRQKLYDLVQLLELEKPNYNELKKSLTHSSFHTDDNTMSKSNSRYVFKGMFSFKGDTANVIFDLLPGTGMQLQQIQGNLFSPAKLNALYDSLNLGQYIRSGLDFDIKNHKHIFVYGLLGYVSEYCNEYEKLNFISTFILPGYDLASLYSGKLNAKAQLMFLSKMKYNTSAKITLIKLTDDNYEAKITVNDHIIGLHQSKSKEYATKKAIKKALVHIADSQSLSLKNETAIALIEKNKLESVRKEHKERKKVNYESFLQKQKLNKERREENKLKIIREAEEREKSRRDSKQKRKQRLEEINRIKSQRATVPLSGKKRRFLEDKLK